MTSRPAIPSLVLIPDESQVDYAALYAIATAYAHSGLLISEHGKETKRHALSFPAVVCSSFAIELFLKFFLMLERAESEEPFTKHKPVHSLSELWKKICPAHQALVAGMFRNGTGVPSLNASDIQIKLFVEALMDAGEAPFVKWRYAHELVAETFMSHAAINEVLDALGYAANYLMMERSAVSRPDTLTPDAVTIAPDQPDPDPLDRSEGEGLLLVRGSESLLLGRDSVLRQIPVNVVPKQALFLDGIRHAVEIMDVAYGRLREALTHLALHPSASNELPDVIAHVFLDAWSFVDAVNRFQMMYTKMPGMQWTAARGIPSLRDVTQEFRNLRNVADHLARRADFVLSRNGAALGELSWLTGFELQPEVIAWHCTLRPGTLQSVPQMQTTPIVSTLDWPTDSIRLSAGGYEGNLSMVRAHIAVRIRQMESELQTVFQQPIQAQVPVINDMFARRAVKWAGLAGP